MITNIKIFSFVFLCSLLSASRVVSLDFENLQLFDISFQELMTTEVRTGSLLSIKNFSKPVSVTTITSEDIELTPSRNIYDLIETYVPGAFFMTHYDCNPIGIRGIISDRNNKILLMINGRVANQKARVGALSELSNWDMGDIDRIEIIRGPGSVTYGPGAISSVINVITKTSVSKQVNKIALNYYHPYNSQGISGNISHEFSDELKIFAYFSVQQTQGYQPENAYNIMDNTWNYEYNKKNNRFQDYMGDYLGVPQKKFHIELNFLENTKLWARYTNTGSPSNGASLKTLHQTGLDSNNQIIWGNYRNPSIISNEYFILSLEHEYLLNESTSLSGILSYDIENNSRSYGYFPIWQAEDNLSEKTIEELLDQRSLRNMYNNFSESELLANLILRSSISNDIRFAVGTSFSFNRWGAPWGEPDNMIRMGDKSNIISGKDSPVYGDGRFFGVDSASAIFVGSGWSTFMYSVYGEAEAKLSDKLSLLMSTRIDKDDYSDLLISPRFAVIYQIDNNNVLKLIGQQSNRMNTAEELFLQNRAGNVSSPEKLNTAELIYSTTFLENTLFEFTSYYSNIDILSWHDPDRSTRTTGNLSMIGAEIDFRYKSEFISLGFNQSVTKLLRWELADGVSRSGISYSDYNIDFAGNSSNGVGNNLNNWSNFASKLYGNIKLFDEKIILHINARLFWDFEGAKDGLELIGNIIEGHPEEEKLRNILNTMKKNGFYEYDFRLNASVNVRFIENVQISLYAMNLTNIGNNYRYNYEAGNKTDDFLFRMNVLEEPFTFGINLSYEI